MEELIIHEFRPLFLSLDRIGPFRDLHSIDFTNTAHHPCNFYMMVSANGLGKTTALEVFCCLIELLGKKDIPGYGHEDLDRKAGRAQLDIWVRLHWQGRNRAIILSIVAGRLGEATYLKPWLQADVVQYSAESWHCMGFRNPLLGRYENIASRQDELLKDFSAAIRASMEDGGLLVSSGFHLPTVLYFSAYRDIPPVGQNRFGMEENYQTGEVRNISQPFHWNYCPLHSFAAHSTVWLDSLDNLLVWLKWLDNGTFETAQALINEQVFSGTSKCLKGVRKSPPEAQVDAGDGETHRLDRLSSGEKSLVQLFLRISAHATANTIILIDEMDAHLHIRWVHRLYNALEKLVLDHPGFMVIMTTHSTEILRRFSTAMQIEREGLYLGGELIEEKDLI